MRKKKICFVCESILTIGGVQRVLAVIASALAQHCEVSILTLNDTPSMDQGIYGLNESNVKIHFLQIKKTKGVASFLHKLTSGLYKKVFPKNAFTSAIYARSSFPKKEREQFVEWLNKGNFDTIIGVHGGLSIKLATIRKQLNAKRVIGWMHNSYEAFFENKPSYYPHLWSHFKYQMQRLDDFVVLCHTDAQKYYQQMGIHPRVIYNPLTLTPGPTSTLQSKHFLCIGRMTPGHKGFDILINAFAQFAKTNAEWQLDIVGEGAEELTLRQLIEQKQMQERISIHPFTHQIQAYYSCASAYVLSSRWEGMPLVLAEAMSHGLPIISSNIPVSMEILNSENALFFEKENTEQLAKALTRYATLSDMKKKEMQQASLSIAAKFSINQILQNWEDIC